MCIKTFVSYFIGWACASVVSFALAYALIGG